VLVAIKRRSRRNDLHHAGFPATIVSVAVIVAVLLFVNAIALAQEWYA
jgi:hypothetical protein